MMWVPRRLRIPGPAHLEVSVTVAAELVSRALRSDDTLAIVNPPLLDILSLTIHAQASAHVSPNQISVSGSMNIADDSRYTAHYSQVHPVSLVGRLSGCLIDKASRLQPPCQPLSYNSYALLDRLRGSLTHLRTPGWHSPVRPSRLLAIASSFPEGTKRVLHPSLSLKATSPTTLRISTPLPHPLASVPSSYLPGPPNLLATAPYT